MDREECEFECEEEREEEGTKKKDDHQLSPLKQIPIYNPYAKENLGTKRIYEKEKSVEQGKK